MTKTVLCIGTGQQGAAAILSLLENRPGNWRIIAYDRDAETRRILREKVKGHSEEHITIIDHLDNPVVHKADLVHLFTPVGATESCLKELTGKLKSGYVLADSSSIKKLSMELMRKHAPEGFSAIIGVHSLAGRAIPGIGEAFAGLFEGFPVFVMPQIAEGEELDEAAADAAKLCRRFWNDVRQNNGATIVTAAEHHDRLLARSLYFAHIYSFSLMKYLGDAFGPRDVGVLDNNAILEITRVSNAGASLWCENLLGVREHMLEVYGQFTENLEKLKAALRSSSRGQLLEHVRYVHRHRQKLQDKRPWENVMGDVATSAYQCQGASPEKLNGKGSLLPVFKKAANIRAVIRRVGMPALTSVAFGMTALNGGHLNGFNINQVANNSLYGITGILRGDPDYITNLLYQNRLYFMAELQKFTKALKQFMGAIEREDREALTDLIGNVARTRASMPPPRDPEALREEYIIPPQAPAVEPLAKVA